ncbi:MAG: hypothetical protein OXN89_10780 [Bryobacterales bacterium]|nr:hypothetical protein [Bryobacterales bacterium]
MKKKLNIGDKILRPAEVRTAETGQRLTRPTETALRDHLASTSCGEADFRLELLVKRGRLVRGVTVNDRNALYERMEGRS